MPFFFSSRSRHTRWTGDWSSDVCSSDLRSHGAKISGKTNSLSPDQGTRGSRGATLFRRQHGGLFADASRVRDYILSSRSEERRVGKECRSRVVRWWWRKKNER